MADDSDAGGRNHGVSRRVFLGAASAAAGFTIVPRHVLGGAGFVPPSDKLNLAFIGVGAQGLRVMLNFLKQPDVQGIAVCDVNQSSADYPQWGQHEFQNSVQKLLGVSSGWDWLSPETPIKLIPSLQVTAGVAGREPCQKIVDAYNGKDNRSGQSKGCAAYSDFRELLAKEQGVDGVVVCTPDHWHAPVSMAAMRLKKHVYVQKPSAHIVGEARQMAQAAQENGVATQVAVSNSASENTRLLCEWIWSGAIGPVRRVDNWSSRPFWPQGIDRPQQADPVPAGLDWDLWLGPAPERPFNHAYVPFVWRGWYDFGEGSLGDMGHYSFDTIFRVLKLTAPTKVESSSTDRFKESFPLASIIRYEFPARESMPPVTLVWYDGRLKPARPDELEDDRPLQGPGSDDGEGLLFIGDEGKILCGFNGEDPRLIPESKMKAFQPPPKTLTRSPGHYREWIAAAKGGPPAAANLQFEAPVVESVLLGVVAVQSGEMLRWDGANLRVTNSSAAQALIEPKYRGQWDPK